MNGIQEVSGSIPLISTKESKKKPVFLENGLFHNFFERIDIPLPFKFDSICTRMVGAPHFFHRMNATHITTYFP